MPAKRRQRSKPIYYCVIESRGRKSDTLGAIYGCSKMRPVALKHLERAIDRGARGFSITTTFFPPPGHRKWLAPAH